MPMSITLALLHLESSRVTTPPITLFHIFSAGKKQARLYGEHATSR